MVLNREEFFARLQAKTGTDTSDDTIAFIEDMTDTYNELERMANGDGEDWKAKYHELDESWKKKYSHRFFSGGDKNVPSNVTEIDENDEYDPTSVTVEELFK